MLACAAVSRSDRPVIALIKQHCFEVPGRNWETLVLVHQVPALIQQISGTKVVKKSRAQLLEGAAASEKKESDHIRQRVCVCVKESNTL